MKYLFATFAALVWISLTSQIFALTCALSCDNYVAVPIVFGGALAVFALTYSGLP